MKKTITVDGNEACAYTSYLFTEVAGIYPITPSSPMAEHLDEWSTNQKNNLWNDQVKVINGPFADFIGTVTEISKEKHKVKVLVSMFGRETPVELDFAEVEKLN